MPFFLTPDQTLEYADKYQTAVLFDIIDDGDDIELADLDELLRAFDSDR